ncbi:helix-turn-helix domain-containing protein [Pseudomonas subflava]|uniref:helix-turn-helix domain-containing protein n=1 Tax=Pseudomonas subflava TaxID=2952933 RepID=UPI00207AAF90|nr:helix-turn-helix transcriptional regulator [Pseudomonas subflava]
MANLILLQPSLGGALRRWRVQHRIKQSHAAGLFGVNQSTISRWETGVQEMSPGERARVERLLLARLDSAADAALARLVQDSTKPVHLVCDLSHRLLACSSARAAEFALPLSALLGESLWPFATEEIALREAALDDLGWRDIARSVSVEFASGANGSPLVPIVPSRCRWTRLMLSDGTAARLVETLDQPRP